MFLDKALLNYAASMGIKQHLKGDEFSNLSTIFGASYIFMEPIVTYLIQRFPISKVMSSFIICWGIVLTCHSACKTYASLMIVRTLLGAFESASAVGCIAVSGMYYTKSEQSARIGFWAAQAGTGYIVGGLISFGFCTTTVKSLLRGKSCFWSSDWSLWPLVSSHFYICQITLPMHGS